MRNRILPMCCSIGTDVGLTSSVDLLEGHTAYVSSFPRDLESVSQRPTSPTEAQAGSPTGRIKIAWSSIPFLFDQYILSFSFGLAVPCKS